MVGVTGSDAVSAVSASESQSLGLLSVSVSGDIPFLRTKRLSVFKGVLRSASNIEQYIRLDLARPFRSHVAGPQTPVPARNHVAA